MTVPILKIKVMPRTIVKGKMDVRFPGLVSASSPILLDKAGGNFVFSMDIDSLTEMLVTTFQPYEGVDQHITSAGPVTVANNAGIVRVDQTIGAGMTLDLPLAAAKTCPVLICDWKGDAGTNLITVNPSGTEKIQGQTVWAIASDNASIYLRPIPGVGYAI